MLRFTQLIAPVLFLTLLAACQQLPVVPASRAPLAEMSDPACPNINGTYSFLGEPLPGKPPFFHKVVWKVTLDRLLGLNWSADEQEISPSVQLIQDNSIELMGESSGESLAGRFDLRPGDTVVCSQGEMTIRQQREVRGYSFEQLWRITRTARTLKLDQDGSLIVNTHIRTAYKSSLLADVTVEDYGARFRRLY